MEAELKFEREDIEGVGVVGSYLIDAARRLGVYISDDCGRLGLCDSCCVKITAGAEFLSEPTRAEREMLSEERLTAGNRLSCQAKIASAGEISVETIVRPDPRTERERRDDDYRRDFEALPLEQKVAQLVEFEMVTLNETLSYVLNAPYKIGGKLVDFMSGFGFGEGRHAPAAATENGAEDDGKSSRTAEDAERNDEVAEAEYPDEAEISNAGESVADGQTGGIAE